MGAGADRRNDHAIVIGAVLAVVIAFGSALLIITLTDLLKQ